MKKANAHVTLSDRVTRGPFHVATCQWKSAWPCARITPEMKKTPLGEQTTPVTKKRVDASSDTTYQYTTHLEHPDKKYSSILEE
ncbi:hypothetical protein [Aquicoccus sp.]|uniref:hypothetical protein n=1 Tax=Aquicoccus sp. TaxID=2055851 RepID=UPI003561CD00